MSRQWWGSLRSTHPTRLCFRSSPACGRSGGPSPSDQLSAFSFQLCPASSCPGNRPPGAVYSPVYFCARLLFHNSTDIRRTSPGLLSIRAHASQRCQLPFVGSTPRAVGAKGARYLFWADLTEPCRGPRRFLRHKTLYRKYLQRPIFSFCINHCRIMVYIQLCPLTAAAYFGGNASCNNILNNDLQHAHPQQWLFFRPKKPRKNSEGVL